jgi:hypothetical protein
VHTDPGAVRRARQAIDDLEATWRGRVDHMTDVLAGIDDPTKKEANEGDDT